MTDTLTKREAIAAQVLAGMMANRFFTESSANSFENFASTAVGAADALLAELARTASSIAYDRPAEYPIEPDNTLLKAEPEAPWYPDDSGEWIEHNGARCPVAWDTLVEVLTWREREDRQHQYTKGPARIWRWSHIVAYRLVKG